MRKRWGNTSLGNSSEILAAIKKHHFYIKNGIQFGASGRASVGRACENRRVRRDWRDRGVERHLRWYVEHLICWGDFFPWGEKQMDRSLGLLSLSSPFIKPFGVVVV